MAQIADLRCGRPEVGSFLVTLKELHKSAHRLQKWRLVGGIKSSTLSAHWH